MNKTMIKMGVCIGFYMGLMIGLTGAANFTLLSLHELDFYYTLDGFKLQLIAAGVEALIAIPFTRWYFEKILGTEKFYQIFGEIKEDEEEEP